MFLSHYILKLITIPTRVTQSSATLLDNIYTTDPMSGQNGVFTYHFSDHFSISLSGKICYKIEFTNKNISQLNKQF